MSRSEKSENVTERHPKDARYPKDAPPGLPMSEKKAATREIKGEYRKAASSLLHL
jgi:hypothetical protein